MKRNILFSKKIGISIIVFFTVLFKVGYVSGATYYSRGNLAPNLTTSWAVNTDGSGSQPGNFTTAGDIFIVQNGHSMTMSANWAVTGNVVINNGGTLTSGAYTLTISGTTTVGGGTSGALNITSATGTKSFYGLVTINAGATWNNTGNSATSFAGGITHNGTTFNNGTGAAAFSANQSFSGAGNMTFGGSVTPATGTTLINSNSGIVTVSSIVLTGNFTQGSNTPTLALTGATPFSGTGTFDANTYTNTVNYTGAAQTAKVTTYSNLTLSGSGNKTFSTTPTVNGLLSLEGTASVIVTTGVVTYGANATLQYNKPAAYTATSEEWITTFAGTGGVIIRNTGAITTNSAKTLSAGVPLTVNAGGQLTIAGFNFTATWTTTISGALNITSTTGTKSFYGLVTINTGATWNNSVNEAVTFRGGITNNGTFTAGTGIHTFDTNAQAVSGTISIPNVTVTVITFTNYGNLTVGTALAGTGGLTNSATGVLNIGGTSAITTLTATAAGNTVNYNGAGAQAVKAVAYSTLILSGSGAKSITSGTSITGNLSIAPPASTATASIGAGLNISAGSLAIGGTGTIAGSWGSSSSSATNQNNTYFAATTGIINVTNNTCTPLSAPTTTGAQVCVGTTATLSASGATAGQVYKWYSAESGGTLLKTSTNNTDNTYTTPVLSATTNYWVAILNPATGCESARTQVTATFPVVSADERNRAGTGTWIGHVFKRLDSSPGAPSDANAFTNYYGTITEPETFNESFGGTNSCLPLTATESARTVYTEYFAARFRMNSSKTGVYLADIGSDDGARLTVDGTLIYNQWVERGYVTDALVLFTLTGTSNLLLEYYESTGGNQVSFQNLAKVPNNLTSGTGQTFCATTPGSQISANNAFTNAPISGNAAFTVTYQWQQATNSAGPWSDIPGATFQDFTPPGLTAGSHYFRRKLTVSGTNPGTIAVSAVDYSDIATVTVNPLPATGEIIPD